LTGRDHLAEKLIDRLERDEPAALGLLFDHYRATLRHEIEQDLAADPRLNGRFDASDVVQEVFLDSQQQIAYFLANRTRISFLGWLRGLARERRLKFVRAHLDAQCRTVRKQQALPDDSGNQPEDSGSSPSNVAARAEECQRVRIALDQLKSDERDVIRLRIHEAKTNREVAELLGLTPEAVAKRLERAMQRLKEVMGPTSGGTTKGADA